MKTLEEIRSGFDELFMQIEDAGWTDESELALEALFGDLQSKAGGYIVVAKEYDAAAAMLKDLSKRYADKAKAKAATAERIRARLTDFMIDKEIDVIETEVGKIHLRKTESVYIDPDVDASAMPEKFVKIVPEQYKPDKTAIKTALKNGEEVPGAALDINHHIRVA